MSRVTSRLIIGSLNQPAIGGDRQTLNRITGWTLYSLVIATGAATAFVALSCPSFVVPILCVIWALSHIYRFLTLLRLTASSSLLGVMIGSLLGALTLSSAMVITTLVFTVILSLFVTKGAMDAPENHYTDDDPNNDMKLSIAQACLLLSLVVYLPYLGLGVITLIIGTLGLICSLKGLHRTVLEATKHTGQRNLITIADSTHNIIMGVSFVLLFSCFFLSSGAVLGGIPLIVYLVTIANIAAVICMLYTMPENEVSSNRGDVSSTGQDYQGSTFSTERATDPVAERRFQPFAGPGHRLGGG